MTVSDCWLAAREAARIRDEDITAVPVTTVDEAIDAWMTHYFPARCFCPTCLAHYAERRSSLKALLEAVSYPLMP